MCRNIHIKIKKQNYPRKLYCYYLYNKHTTAMSGNIYPRKPTSLKQAGEIRRAILVQNNALTNAQKEALLAKLVLNKANERTCKCHRCGAECRCIEDLSTRLINPTHIIVVHYRCCHCNSSFI
jgi:hypothetical protein